MTHLLAWVFAAAVWALLTLLLAQRAEVGARLMRWAAKPRRRRP